MDAVGRSWPIVEESFQIGRDPGADLMITDDHNVSRIHARLVRRGRSWWIEDLDSRNGTFLNGTRIERHRLKSGDVVRVGVTELRVVTAESSPALQGRARPRHAIGAHGSGRRTGIGIVTANDVSTLRGFVAESWSWIRHNWVRTLLFSATAFLIGWVWNTYLMAKGLDGSDPSGSSTSSTADGRDWNGIYWLLVSTIGFGLVTYAGERGVQGFFDDLASLPRSLVESFEGNRVVATALLLWGMALSLTIATFVSDAVAGALGCALLLLASTPLALILSHFLIRAWKGLYSIAAPGAGQQLSGMASAFLIMTGESLGMFVARFAIPGDGARVRIAVASLVVSCVLARTGGRGSPVNRAASILVALGLSLAWQMSQVGVALADDGGWNECQRTDVCRSGLRGVLDWVHSDGADHVLQRAAIGGTGASLGAIVGAAVGGVLGAAAAGAGGIRQASGLQTDGRAGDDLSDRGEGSERRPPGEESKDGDWRERSRRPSQEDVLPDAPDKRRSDQRRKKGADDDDPN